jgi:asparagine synthase (glutamine-hydrolysing)
MCGLCGAFNADGAPVGRESVLRMRAALAHRGPDDEGEWFDGPAGLGFRRLSILDLENGHQPQSSPDGRVTMVFNGEIYNHPQLKDELISKGARYKTRSDTETILLLYLREGLEAFSRLDGMFAVALYDARQRRLVLARDPLGIKPLYYSFDGRALLFSSELRSLLAGGVSAELDQAGVLDYLAYGKVHAPRTIVRDALKLPAGHTLTIDDAGLELKAFWKPRRRKPQPVSLREAEDGLDAVLSASVKASLLSDVPVGCFLSGGVDSSLVAAYMVKHAGKEVQTFSVGFEGAEKGVDESAFARQAARYLKTKHHELMLPANVLSKLDEAIALLDEPIADSAILPTYLLAREARKSVKVVLTGEGADELFAGYNRHKAAWLNEKLRSLPAWGRGLAAPLARRLGKGGVFEGLPYEGARDWAEATASARLSDLESVLHRDFWESARRVDSLDWLKEFDAMGELDDALIFDLRTVLADSLLMKVDKTTMRASLEARVPFLNKSVVEHALGLPAALKIRRFKGKYLLRRVAERHLPRELVWRRKHGFIVPWEGWVRDPANPTLRRLLDGSALSARGLFDMERLRLFHRQLCAGSREVEAGLFFRIAVLGLWLESVSSAGAPVR